MSDDDGGIGDLIEGFCDLLAELPLAFWPVAIVLFLLFLWYLQH